MVIGVDKKNMEEVILVRVAEFTNQFMEKIASHGGSLRQVLAAQNTYKRMLL
jgi:hypothetical protein